MTQLCAQELDSEDLEHAAWWESLLVVCDEELKEAAKQDDVDRAKLRRERPLQARRHREVGVHFAVDAEIQSLLAGTATCSKAHTFRPFFCKAYTQFSGLVSVRAPTSFLFSPLLRGFRVLHCTRCV